MKGKHKVTIYNNRIHYELEIKRNITIIQGDSATGKTTLINMIRQAENLGISSGIKVVCDVPCRVLEGANWELILKNSAGCIFFVDEENYFINTEAFALAIRGSDNYFVLITRENLYNLPYSVEEIYGLHNSGKYMNTKKVYQQMFHIYGKQQNVPIVPKKVITEDSNAGFEFFKYICDESGVVCESANGKSKLVDKIKNESSETVCIVADGAAIGAEMNRLYYHVLKRDNIFLYLPESFEWIILNSGLIKGNECKYILEHTQDYADSKEYFSWEQYYTKLLREITDGTHLKYNKSKLNETYLHEKNRQMIIRSIDGLKL